MTQEQVNSLRRLQSAKRHLQQACAEAVEQLDRDMAALTCDHRTPSGGSAWQTVMDVNVCAICGEV